MQPCLTFTWRKTKCKDTHHILYHFQGHFILYKRTENHWYTSSEHQWYQWGACPEPIGYWETAPTPAAACSLCCCLAKDTDVPSVVLLEFWLHDFWIHLPLSTLNAGFFKTMWFIYSLTFYMLPMRHRIVYVPLYILVFYKTIKLYLTWSTVTR